MKTLLVSVLFALVGVSAVNGCSSSTTPALVTTTDSGTVQQDQPCSQTSDCESPLVCGYPVVNDAGTCPSTGVCVTTAPCTYMTVCPCGGTSYVNACVTSTYATAPISPAGTGCAMAFAYWE